MSQCSQVRFLTWAFIPTTNNTKIHKRMNYKKQTSNLLSINGIKDIKLSRCGGMVDTLVLKTSPVSGCRFESCQRRFREHSLMVRPPPAKRLTLVRFQVLPWEISIMVVRTFRIRVIRVRFPYFP